MKQKRLKRGLAARIFLTAFLALASAMLSAQAKNVTGTVVDVNGQPVPGTSVSVRGTSAGVTTGGDGRFSIRADSRDVLVFNFLGYQEQSVPVGNQTDLQVVLQEDTQLIDEVVVVGYGVVRKSDVTGAVTRVSEQTLKERPVQNALQAMQGKAAGVQITTNSRPGELGEVRIRGNRSINASNDPLYVVDGIPMAAGSINDINPNDISSMEVLKDASATAIYGSRGANGVILVTTKKGTKGKATISYDGTFSFTKLHSMTDWMDGGQRIDWLRQGYINTGTYTGNYGNAPDPNIDRNTLFQASAYGYMEPVFQSAFQFNADGTPVLRPATDHEKSVLGYADRVPVYDASKIPTTPWTDYVLKTALTTNNQVSLSSGSDNSRLYMSFAYLNQESPMVDQDFERYTINMNGDITPAPWLTVGASINGSHSIQNYGIAQNTGSSNPRDSYGVALSLEPFAPAYDEDGGLLRPTGGPSQHNVLLNIHEAQHERRYYSFMLSSYAEITILPWLKWRTNFGTQFRNSREGHHYGENFTNPLGHSAADPNVAYNNQSQRLAWTLENLIFVNKTFNDIHTVGVTLLQSAEKNRAEGLSIRSFGNEFPTALWYSPDKSDKTRLDPGGSYSMRQIASYMARLNYNLMDKYLLTVTGRWDGASVLAENNKWDFFPSAALAWKVDQEKFMEGANWVNELKFRIGYGVTGNSSISPYQTGGSMTTDHAGIGFGQGSVSPHTVGGKANVLPNRELGWEKTASMNIGLDFSLLNGRISGSMEYYDSKTSDLLLSRSIPITVGYTSIISNIGKTRNRGFEVSLSTVNVRTKNFTWRTDFTFFTNKEEVTELINGKEDQPANGWFIGQPLDVIWTKKFDRLWQDTPEDRRLMELYKTFGAKPLAGQAKLVDQPLVEVPKGTENSETKTITVDGKTEEITYLKNGFGTFDNDDNHFQGSFRPKWEGGFTTTFTYKNWELNSFIYGRFGGKYYGLLKTYGRRVETDVWSPANPGGRYPQNRTGGTSFDNYSEYMNYTSGNMVIVRHIGLSYAVPQEFLKKISLSRCSIYAQVLNPFVFGGDLVKVGINPDDTTGWTATERSNGNYKFETGRTNNTLLNRSFVLGLRVGF